MNEIKNQGPMLSMSAPPFWHCGRTLRRNSLLIILALLPAAVSAAWHWGIPAVRVMALSSVSAVLAEMLCQKLMQRNVSPEDGTAAVTGLVFAMLLPAAAPWWMVVLGACIAIALGKMVFGGHGANPVSAVLVGWALLSVSFPDLMDPNSMLLSTDYADPLFRLKYYGAKSVEGFSYADLLLGNQIGALGASQSGALLIGGFFLAATGVIHWEIAVSFLLGIILSAGALDILLPGEYASPFFHVFTGSSVLCAFWLATESSCSPDRPAAMILYGLAGGILTIIIRVFGMYSDGAPFAVMLINLLTPYFNLIAPKPFGHVRK